MGNDAPHLPHMVVSELHSLSGFYAWECDCGRRGGGRAKAIVDPEAPFLVQLQTRNKAAQEVFNHSQRHIEALGGWRVDHATTEVA